MNVSFLKPPIGGIIGLEMITFVEPLGLECVAGALEVAGHRCQILDLRLEDADQAMSKLRAFEPQIVGLQCNFTTERYRALRLAQRVKEQLPEVMVVIGGHDASRDPEWFVHPAVDVVAVGDGEEILPALATAVDRGQPLDSVPGLMLVTPDGPVHTGHAPARSELDDLPMPARHLIR
ncbi:MAG: cobalamin-dependent protein, partial [Acidobacteria bacterium]|nr:cobalamin-dependent protein [Acidobacteriota bacterium]